MPGTSRRSLSSFNLASRIRRQIRPRLLAWVLPKRTDVDLERIGSRYGGWIVPCGSIHDGSICYLAGLGEDSSLDRALASRGCKVYVFDPTPRAIEHATTAFAGLANVTFLPVGLWSSSASLRFFAPSDPGHVSHSIVNLQKTKDWFEAKCQDLRSIMDRFAHDRIDFLKLDIEGAEFEVLDDLIRGKMRPGSICVEFDQPCGFWKVVAQLKALRRVGYRIVATEHWNVTLLHDDVNGRARTKVS